MQTHDRHGEPIRRPVYPRRLPIDEPWSDDGSATIRWRRRHARLVVTILAALATMLALVAATWILTAPPARAHDWYDPACCSGIDCAPIVPSKVSASPYGWIVTLEPGDHPLVVQPTTAVYPYDSPRVRPSQDQDFHACVSAMRQAIEPMTTGQHLYCLYVPEMAG